MASQIVVLSVLGQDPFLYPGSRFTVSINQGSPSKVSLFFCSLHLDSLGRENCSTMKWFVIQHHVIFHSRGGGAGDFAYRSDQSRQELSIKKRFAGAWAFVAAALEKLGRVERNFALWRNCTFVNASSPFFSQELKETVRKKTLQFSATEFDKTIWWLLSDRHLGLNFICL